MFHRGHVLDRNGIADCEKDTFSIPLRAVAFNEVLDDPIVNGLIASRRNWLRGVFLCQRIEFF